MSIVLSITKRCTFLKYFNPFFVKLARENLSLKIFIDSNKLKNALQTPRNRPVVVLCMLCTSAAIRKITADTAPGNRRGSCIV
jgi:hypothetical protein